MSSQTADPILGFSIDRDSRKLVLTFITTAFIILGLGGIAAFFVAFTRAPSIQLLDPYWYYLTLTYHGVMMLTMFPHLFEMGLIIYVATALLGRKLWSTQLAWVGYWLVLAGILTIMTAIGMGSSSVMYTMYVPLKADGIFYLGHFVYAVGLLVEVIVWSMTIVQYKTENPTRSLPLVTYGAGVLVILAVASILSAVVAVLPATLWAFRIWVDSVDPMVFKMAFWGMGHTLQYVNVVGMVMAWYMIGAYAHHSKPVSEKFSRMAFALYTLTTIPVMAHHLIVDPTFTPLYKYLGATAFGFFLGIPSIMHGLAVPAAVEQAARQRMRASGETPTVWSFIKRWGWQNPAMILMAFSVLLFGLGGFDGTMATTVPLNMIFHNTLFITAHFHGTLAAGMAVSYMALGYYLLPALGIDIVGRSWTRFQAWCTGIGFTLLIASMHWAAELGVPRRAQDITYTHAGAPVPNWFLPMDTLVIGGTLAVVGLLLFVGIALASIIRHKPSAERHPLRDGLWGEPWVGEKFQLPGAAAVAAAGDD